MKRLIIICMTLLGFVSLAVNAKAQNTSFKIGPTFGYMQDFTRLTGAGIGFASAIEYDVGGFVFGINGGMDASIRPEQQNITLLVNSINGNPVGSTFDVSRERAYIGSIFTSFGYHFKGESGVHLSPFFDVGAGIESIKATMTGGSGATVVFDTVKPSGLLGLRLDFGYDKKGFNFGWNNAFRFLIPGTEIEDTNGNSYDFQTKVQFLYHTSLYIGASF